MPGRNFPPISSVSSGSRRLRPAPRKYWRQRDGNKVYKNLDANSLRNLLADVAKHLQMFEKDDGAKDEDDGTGVMKVPGVASKEDWNGQ